MTVAEIQNLISRSQERTPKTRKQTCTAQQAITVIVNHREKIQQIWSQLSSTEEQHLYQIWSGHA